MKRGFVQRAYSVLLGGNHLGLVYCDVGNHKALDDVSIAFDKASRAGTVALQHQGELAVPSVIRFVYGYETPRQCYHRVIQQSPGLYAVCGQAQEARS